MKRKNTVALDSINLLEVLFGEDKELRRAYYEYKLRTSYFEVAGENHRVYIENISIKKRLLIIQTNSAGFRHELMSNRGTLTVALNQHVGESVIDDILYK